MGGIGRMTLSNLLCLFSLLLLIQMVTMKSGEESTALVAAAQSGDWSEVRRVLLHSSFADIDVPNEFGSTALIYAAKAGNVEICRELLDMGADVNVQDSFSHTSLLEASRSGYYDVVKVLLDAGADVDARDFGETALMWASEAGHEDIVKLLVERGADVNAQSNIGDTALISAVSHGRYGTVKFLLDNGADVDAEDGQGYSAYMWASLYSDYREIQDLLLKKGASSDSPLIIASRRCRVDMIKYLLETKIVDVNLQEDHGGNTALIEAIMHCDGGDDHGGVYSFFTRILGNQKKKVSKLENAVTLFLQDERTDVSLKNKAGEDALQVAVRLMRSQGVLSLLRQAMGIEGLDSL